MDLKVNLAGMSLEHPLMNAAGTCKLLEGQEGFNELVRSATAAIMVGSITLEPRPGNSGNVFWSDDLFSLNSSGLPNPGLEYYQNHLPKMLSLARQAPKPLFVSIVGFSVEEYVQLTEFALATGADLVELNLSCPNIWDEGRQKSLACFDPNLVVDILFGIETAVPKDAKIAVKLAPFSDVSNLGKVVTAITQSKIVRAVTTCNTFPNALCYDEHGKPRTTPEQGLAGLGGKALKPIGLGQVKQLRELLPEQIDIIGVGGISTAQDIFDYQRAGAVAVQIATPLLNRGPKIFSELLAELIDLQNN